MAVLKFGLICDVDAGKGMARVYLQEDDVTTNWIPMSVPKTLNDKWSFPFDINEHVWCMMDEHNEFGVIGGAIYNTTDKPDAAAVGKFRVVFADKTAIEYDNNAKILTIDCVGDIKVIAKNVDVECEQANVEVSGAATVKALTVEIEGTTTATMKAPVVNIDAPVSNFSGIVAVTGALTAATIATTGGGAIETAGPISAQSIEAESMEADSATIGGKDFLTHTHTAPSGGGATSPPL